jgi:hypothetical protein
MAIAENEHPYSKQLWDLMREHHPPLTIREMAHRTGVSYEQIRKVLSGAPVASEKLHVKIAKTLRLPPERAQQLWQRARLEKLQSRFGREAVEAAGSHSTSDPLLKSLAALDDGPRVLMAELLRHWPQIKPEDQRRILDIARAWAEDPLTRDLAEEFGGSPIPVRRRPSKRP